MKKMRLIALISILSMMMVFGLVGCGDASSANSNSPVVGTWNIVGAVVGEEEIILADMGMEMEMTLDFKADGTFSGVVFGEEGSGKWRTEGDKYIVEEGDTKLECTIKDEKLYMTMDGDTVFFEKEAAAK